MAIFRNTLDALVERTFKLCLGDWYEGECDAGSTTTIVDATRGEAEDFFQNIDAWARIRTTTDDAAPKGEEREITDWVKTGGTATVAPVMTASEAGDTYAFYAGWRWDEVKSAINAAIDLFAAHALVEKLDQSIQLKSSVYEYALPDGMFVYLYRISMADSDGNFPEPIDPMQYKIIRGASPPRIHIYRTSSEAQLEGHYVGGLFGDSGITDNRILRVEGLGRQAYLSSDTDICYLNPDLVCFQAAALLHARKIRRSDVDPDEHSTQFGVWQSMADAISGGAPSYRALHPQLPPNAKRVDY